MAPFTTSSTSVTEVESSNSDEKLVQSFMRDLANYMQSIKATQKYLVSFIYSGTVDSCNKIVLFLNNACTPNCSCGRPNPFPSGCVPSCSGFRSCCSTKFTQYSEGSDCERVKYPSYEIEHTILVHRMGKKCKQRFLKADQKDSYISKSRRGYGGNVAALTCMTIAQERIPSEVIQQFQDGKKFSLLFTCVCCLNLLNM